MFEQVCLRVAPTPSFSGQKQGLVRPLRPASPRRLTGFPPLPTSNDPQVIVFNQLKRIDIFPCVRETFCDVEDSPDGLNPGPNDLGDRRPSALQRRDLKWRRLADFPIRIE